MPQAKTHAESLMEQEMIDTPEQVEEVEVKKEEEKPAAPKFDIYQLLAETKGAPTKEVINQWKVMYNGDVYAAVLGRGEIFVFRPIYRLEWKQIQTQIGQMKQADEAAINEMICKKCCLYPNLNDQATFATLKAGTITTLFEQISWFSNFMDTSMAIQMVVEL